MNKPFAIALAVIGWAGVVVVMNFSAIVPHASASEVKPFIAPVWIFAVIATALVIKTFMRKPKQ